MLGSGLVPDFGGFVAIVPKMRFAGKLFEIKMLGCSLGDCSVVPVVLRACRGLLFLTNIEKTRLHVLGVNFAPRILLIYMEQWNNIYKKPGKAL